MIQKKLLKRNYDKSGLKKKFHTYTFWTQEELFNNKKILKRLGYFKNKKLNVTLLSNQLKIILYPHKTLEAIKNNLLDLKNDRYELIQGCLIHCDAIGRANARMYNKDPNYADGRNELELTGVLLRKETDLIKSKDIQK